MFIYLCIFATRSVFINSLLKFVSVLWMFYNCIDLLTFDIKLHIFGIGYLPCSIFITNTDSTVANATIAILTQQNVAATKVYIHTYISIDMVILILTVYINHHHHNHSCR